MITDSPPHPSAKHLSPQRISPHIYKLSLVLWISRHLQLLWPCCLTGADVCNACKDGEQTALLNTHIPCLLFLWPRCSLYAIFFPVAYCSLSSWSKYHPRTSVWNYPSLSTTVWFQVLKWRQQHMRDTPTAASSRWIYFSRFLPPSVFLWWTIPFPISSWLGAASVAVWWTIPAEHREQHVLPPALTPSITQCFTQCIYVSNDNHHEQLLSSKHWPAVLTFL